MRTSALSPKNGCFRLSEALAIEVGKISYYRCRCPPKIIQHAVWRWSMTFGLTYAS